MTEQYKTSMELHEATMANLDQTSQNPTEVVEPIEYTNKTKTIRTKLLDLESELQSILVHRTEEIRGITLAMLSRHHVLLLGPPGTAKTKMVSQFSKGCGLTFYRRLLNQFTTPDEVFGPVDLKAYKDEGVYRRILKGKAADTQMVYLDEVFKAGPTILNTLLGLMEEREYDNDGTVVETPLQTLVGTSNELPNNEDNLGAFYDRFMLRYVTPYLEDEADFRAMLRGSNTKVTPTLTQEELTWAQDEIASMDISQATYDSVTVLWETIKLELEIYPSDRRFVQMLQIMAADSWMQGYTEVMPSSVKVAQHILWNTPEQIKDVKRLVISSVNPGEIKAQEIVEAAKIDYDIVMATETIAIEDVSVRQQIEEMIETIGNLGPGLDAHKAKLRSMVADIQVKIESNRPIRGG